MPKIKAIPIKSKTLCERCVYHSSTCSIGEMYCRFCDMFNEHCKCNDVMFGMPCKYFIRLRKGADNGKSSN